MKSIQLESEVGIDGILEIKIPLGSDDARKRVMVTIQPLRESDDRNVSAQEEWHEFVEHTYGSCAGLGLEEPADLPLQKRDWTA